MNKFSKSILTLFSVALLITGCSGGCSSNEGNTNGQLEQENKDPLVMILKQRSDTLSTVTSEHVTKILDYTKIPFQTLDIGLSSEGFSIPESVRLLCITTTEVDKFSDTEFDKILKFLADGNDLFITAPIFDPRFNFLEGIKFDADYRVDDKANGYLFNKMIFPNYEFDSFQFLNPYYHKSLHASVFSDSIEVLASSADSSKTPVLLRNSFNNSGDVYLFNSLTGYDKLNRGIFFSTILRNLEGIAYPVANVGTIFLDDFPAPLYDEKIEPIATEYDTTQADFVTRIWWPDMKKLADSLDITYTALTAFNYNANVVPPFDFTEWQANEMSINNKEVKGSIWLAKDVQQSRHELGLHGYNHFSLWLQDWPNMEFMIASLQAVRKRWRIDNLGKLPASYVPPTNNIDSVGIVALSKAIPQIKYLSSLYIGTVPSGAGREFGPDPYNPELFDYPRITSGFVNDENNAFKMNSLYLLTGIWTHFVHPDDVFQVEQSVEDIYASRNVLGLGWQTSKDYDYGLFDQFKSMLSDIQSSYPNIKFRSVEQAVPHVKDWLNMRLTRKYSNGMQLLETTYPGQLEAQHQKTTSWFMYVNEDDLQEMEESLDDYAHNIENVKIWEGYLVQFETTGDSLSIPDLEQSNNPDSYRIIKENLAGYLNPVYPGDEDYVDTRLNDALAALQNNPGSRKLQEEVIDLAIEFDSVELTLPILEKRLLNDSAWSTEDIERLLRYYGYQDASERAYGFLEKLWQEYRGMSVIMLKGMMVERYGYPNESFRTKWLKRELELKPNNTEVLEKLVTTNQNESTWPKTKEYLYQLIESNPSSDSLYHYTLQRSIYYDEPQQTISLVESFPPSAYSQLTPLAPQIADIYAYNLDHYSKALEWGRRSDTFAISKELEWLLQQERYIAFQERGTQHLRDHPSDDSTRIFVGQQLIYEGFYDEGYRILYPLFNEISAPASTTNLVYKEIGYKSYVQKKDFYRRYPAFFSDSLAADLNHQYRVNEGFKVGFTGNYASDNFDNNIATVGTYAEWGNRTKQTHLVSFDETFVGSQTSNSNFENALSHLGYTYTHKYRSQSMQSTAGAGFYYEGEELRPAGKLGFWYAKDSTFTSGEVTLEPVLTDSSIQQNINRVKTTVYREDFWSKGTLQTTLFAGGSWYSDNVFSIEGTGRLYVQLPFSTAHWRYRGIGELAYSDASTTYTSGMPYYTPDNLFIQGVGAGFRYRDLLDNPNLSLELEVMGKHDLRDGLFFSGSGRLNARIHQYWQVGLNADISSSSVYRYNNFGFNISYTFPNKLK